MTKKLSLAAVLSAVMLLFLYLVCVLPTGRIFIFCLATAPICILMLEAGTRFSICAYVAVSLLALVLLPNKNIALLYALFMGYYPILKCYIEKWNRLLGEWIIKLAVFVLAMIAGSFFCRVYGIPIGVMHWYSYLLLAAVCVVYDIALSYFIQFYRHRIEPYIKK